MIDEEQIRSALAARAREADLPTNLALLTLDSIGEDGRRRFRLPRVRGVRGAPRWMYAPAAAAIVILLFAIGTAVTRPRAAHVEPPEASGLIPPSAPTASAAPTASNTASGAAVGGQVTGVVSSGRASVDAPNTSNVGAQGPGVVAQPPSPLGVFPPKVVRNADIQIQVRSGSFDRSWSRALDVASRYGGYVTNSSTQQSDSRIDSGTFTLRVPASKLDAALKDFRALGVLKSLSTTGNDISGQIADLDGRIKADQTEQAQLLDLMNKADNVTDVLAIRSQLQAVQQDLDSLTSQKKEFQSQVDYATVDVSIFEPNAGPEPEPVPLSNSIMARGWHAATTAGLTILAGALIVLGGLVPLAVIGIAVWALVIFARRRRRNA